MYVRKIYTRGKQLLIVSRKIFFLWLRGAKQTPRREMCLTRKKKYNFVEDVERRVGFVGGRATRNPSTFAPYEAEK